MDSDSALDIFLVAVPGLEAGLAAEARAAGFSPARAVEGGVLVMGGWRDVWRANLELRGASRVLVRIGAFRAMHLAQLDKRARKFPWGDFLRPDVPVRVEATTKASKIWHAGAAVERIETAIREGLGAPIAADAQAGFSVRVMARIDDDLCTLSLDTSGEPLHRRGHKLAVAKAPMRETMAALFLAQCGYTGDETVLDPMCGSGTFVIEAAEIAAGLQPGRDRAFAFEQFAGFDAHAFAALRAPAPSRVPAHRCYGRDLDAGAVRASRDNAARAGVDAWTDFMQADVRSLEPPEGPPGLVIVNPPYAERIGEKREVQALYGALGETLRARFAGWRVGLITSDITLVHAARLRWDKPGAPVLHGGIRVRLWQAKVG